jgi:hypothetical protein
VPIAHYCRRCAGFDDYRAFAAEVLRQEAPIPLLSHVDYLDEAITTVSAGGADARLAPFGQHMTQPASVRWATP